MNRKTCSKCGILKNVSEFSRGKNHKDGLRSWCKECAKQYYTDNKEKIKERDKQYYTDNKEKISVQRKQRSADLTDSYVKGLITKNHNIQEVPQELIDLHRVQIQIERYLKETA